MKCKITFKVECSTTINKIMTIYYNIVVIKMEKYLDNLREKPTPNIKQKDGLRVFFMERDMISPEIDESLVERDEEGNIMADEREEDDMEKREEDDMEKKEVKRSRCKITDSRETSKVNRELLLERLKQSNVLPAVEKKKSQISELSETVVIDKEDEEDKDEKIGVTFQDKDEEKEEDEEEEEEEEEEDKEEKDTKSKKKGVVKARKIAVETEYKDVNTDEVINGVSLKQRLPIKYEHHMKTSKFYMNNRKKFISELVPMFEDYKDEIENPGDKPKIKGFSPMVHQKIVSDYLNLYTPYRGLLLFHGLGSGKTCSSIAIAEGMKSQKKIYVMTLASLKANFFNQMKECGDPIYRLDQFWEFISIDGKPDYVSLLSNILSIPESSVKKRKGAWMVNITKESNFDTLSDDDKKNLNDQVDEMIRSKYIDVNYNGLLETNIDSKLKIPDGTFKSGKENPFDNSVVVIDEVHNFVSMIVNKIRDKKKKSISYQLYEYLMSATNARVVLLSGTPIINYPNEIGVLFNILRGYIKTWVFPVKIRIDGGARPTRDDIIYQLEKKGLTQFDYVAISGETVTITRNPFGFINTQSKRMGETSKPKQKRIKILGKKSEGGGDGQSGGDFQSYTGVTLDETGNLSDREFKRLVVSALNDISKIASVDTKKTKVINNVALPDNSNEFFDYFVELDSSEMKNKTVFQKRVLGLTSYFKGAADELYPSYVPSSEDIIYHIERIPMSSYQFGVYEKVREEESKQEKKSKQRQAKQSGEELFNTSSTYKIGSRLSCNFAFPDPPGRPVKKNGEFADKHDFSEMENEESSNSGKKKTGGGDSDSEEEQEDIRTIEEIVQDDISKPKLQLKEDVSLEGVEVLEGDDKKEDEEDEEDEEDDFVELKKPKKIDPSKKAIDTDFSKQITAALYELNARKDEIFTEEGLKLYSPKFLRILRNIQHVDNTGLHLIYSQFRTLEGIALLKYMLDANGYAQFKIKKSSSGDWEQDEEVEDKGKPKYALHTGTESEEEKKVLLQIYNSKWGEAPSTIVKKFQEEGIENNFMGEVIKVLMITSSGAEGINLKNTRFVHIVEPYWNMVRLEQVIGRARRIASHMDLPVELRNVKVYLYMSIIPDDVVSSDKHKSLRSRDISRLTSKMAKTIDETTFLGRYVRQLRSLPAVISTDQLLFERALQKNQVNSQILLAVKESAMDCALYENESEDLACYKFGQHMTTNSYESHPTIQDDIAGKDVMDVEVKRVSYREYTYNGTVYVLNKSTYQLYNYDDYKKSLKDKKSMNAVGRVIRRNGKEVVEMR